MNHAWRPSWKRKARALYGLQSHVHSYAQVPGWACPGRCEAHVQTHGLHAILNDIARLQMFTWRSLRP